MSLSKDLAEWQWKAGLAHQPTHVAEAEARADIPHTEFVDLAWETFQSDYGEDYSREAVDAAARAVVSEWQSSGRELRSNREDAYSLAAAVGGKLYNGGRGFDPTRKQQEPATGLFGGEIEEEAAKR